MKRRTFLAAAIAAAVSRPTLSIPGLAKAAPAAVAALPEAAAAVATAAPLFHGYVGTLYGFTFLPSAELPTGKAFASSWNEKRGVMAEADVCDPLMDITRLVAQITSPADDGIMDSCTRTIVLHPSEFARLRAQVHDELGLKLLAEGESPP